MKTALFAGLLTMVFACDDGAGNEPFVEGEPEPSVDQSIDGRVADSDVADAGAMDAAPVVDAMPPPLPPLPAIIGPPAATDLNPADGVVEFTLRASQITLPIADELQVRGYGYDDQFPGPLLQARVGDEVVIRFTNDLDEPTTVHWHGLRIPAEMDGSPRVQNPVSPGETFEYRFTVPDAGTFWYHPHVRSNEQVEKGLYGMFVVHEAEPPVFDAERAFVLDDILLDGDRIPPFLQSHPEIAHGRSGNVLLTNGRFEPAPGVARAGQVERWRIVNVANARTMEISIEGARFRVIGTDGGLIAEPYETQRLQLAVGQRYDLEVRYNSAGTARLVSHILAVENGSVVNRPVTLQTIEVDVAEQPPSTLVLPTVEAPERGRATRTVNFEFDTVANPVTGQRWRINGLDRPEDPIVEFQKGDYVRMNIINEANQEHPFHLHGQFFEILPTGIPETEQPGLKDTVLVPGNSRVTIFARLDNPGRWMAHCHILEHAELGMMVEIEVLDAE
jgi:FtsP/CotA-like multicopper oxidase with cupredoxin domain